MNIAGITFIEEGNFNSIHLYKEGSFWKAYERSAHLFVNHIRPYMVKMRRYKNIKEDIISTGFPDVALHGILEGRKVTARQENTIAIELDAEINEEEFTKWKNDCIENLKAMKASGIQQQPAQMCNNEELIERIRSFSLVNSTPMECMSFVVELQKSLQNHGIIQ